MRILLENTVFPMIYVMRLLESYPYIYGGESAIPMEFPTDSSFVSLSLYCELFFGIVKVE